jgi:very-short-patch-repair endonuclease
MQLASELSEPQVVKLALEMCGAYAIDSIDYSSLYDFQDSPDDSPGMCKRPPLTSAAKLKAYAKRLYKQNSRARSAHFLRYVVDGSASPRETALCMLLCMPPRFGGYGLALPELNKRINLSLSEQLMIGAHHFDCDLYWANSRRVGVEYDSRKHHTALEKQEHDAIRRNMLQYKGVQVIVATRMQVNKPDEFDKLARQIGRAVGKRFRIPEREHIEARTRLREVLFDWDVLPTPEVDPIG